MSSCCFLKFKFHWVSYILSGSPNYRGTSISLTLYLVLSYYVCYFPVLISPHVLLWNRSSTSDHNFSLKSIVNDHLRFPEHP